MASTKSGGAPSSHSPGRYEHTGNQEKAYLGRLIRDLGTKEAPPPAEALQRIAERYGRLAEADFLVIGDSIARRVEEEANLRSLLRERVKRFHAVLYDGILQTAGRYRRASDPGGGYVAFGGQQGQKRRPRYQGVAPEVIPAALDEAFQYLKEARQEDDRPARSAVLFYADFVRAHPFYDANGRIGRLLVSFYLYVHARYVNWTKLDAKKSKFISKINACHDRRDSKNRKKYRRFQGYLVDFFERYVTPHEEFYHPGVTDEEPPL